MVCVAAPEAVSKEELGFMQLSDTFAVESQLEEESVELEKDRVAYGEQLNSTATQRTKTERAKEAVLCVAVCDGVSPEELEIPQSADPELRRIRKWLGSGQAIPNKDKEENRTGRISIGGRSPVLQESRPRPPLATGYPLNPTTKHGHFRSCGPNGRASGYRKNSEQAAKTLLVAEYHENGARSGTRMPNLPEEEGWRQQTNRLSPEYRSPKEPVRNGRD
uniref:Uncharacterized protein n=1 Tax=Trichuris muris TaxID=70415 RepID=A0A5S6R018_TRIMR